MDLKTFPRFKEFLTNDLEIAEEPKRSSPSSCRLRSNVVLTTPLAFFDSHKVRTIISPASKRYRVGVWTFPCSEPIKKVFESSPGLAANALYASSPARGTPMKFTRSFPAKAMAKANVPTKTINFRIFILTSQFSTCNKIVQPIKLKPMIITELSLINCLASSVMNEAPLAPLMRIK